MSDSTPSSAVAEPLPVSPGDGETHFEPINRAYNSVFRPGRLSLGVVVPIEGYPHGPVPTMARHLERVRLAEQLGFASIWLRDVPYNVPSFGDAGQTFDPFVYLGLLAGGTERIALGVASIILSLRHPAHVAKAAATADVLSGGRLLLGVASGDRPEEYPALGVPFADRGARFRESFEHMRRLAGDFPRFGQNEEDEAEDRVFGAPSGLGDLLPKPVGGKLPLLITGSSRQDPDWIARHGDGWMIYPRLPTVQAQVAGEFQARVERAGKAPKPVMQPLYVDLAPDPDAPPLPIHLGFRLGSNVLKAYLKALQQAGIHHVALNLRFNQADVDDTLKRLADEVLPDFSS